MERRTIIPPLFSLILSSEGRLSHDSQVWALLLNGKSFFETFFSWQVRHVLLWGEGTLPSLLQHLQTHRDVWHTLTAFLEICLLCSRLFFMIAMKGTPWIFLNSDTLSCPTQKRLLIIHRSNNCFIASMYTVSQISFTGKGCCVEQILTVCNLLQARSPTDVSASLSHPLLVQPSTATVAAACLR